MLPQAKKLFRFRFPAGAIVIVLAILLCSSGHEGVIQESCSQAASALMKVDGLQELLQKNQDQFFVNLLDCSKEIHNQILEAPKSDNCETMNYKAIIPSAVLATVIDDGIPRVIEPTPLATKEQLALLSVYLVFLCHESNYFSCRAAKLSSVIKHPEYRKKLQRLLSDLAPLLDFLNLALIPNWKSDKTTILKNKAGALINMLNQFSKSLKRLSEEAYYDVYKNSESILWRFLSVPLKDLLLLVGVGFCVTRFQSPSFIIIAVVVVGGYFAFYSTLFYSDADKFSGETVAQSSQLKADTVALRDKIVKLKTAMERVPDGYSFSFYDSIHRYFFK